MGFKHFETLLFYCVIIACAEIEDDLIFDYFIHKKVPNIVGFTCDKANDDLTLIKRLNKIGIKVMLYNLYNGSINHVIQANYHKIGIFIDIRYCDRIVIGVALGEAANSRFYDELRSWLLLGNSLENSVKIIDDRSFGLSTDFVIVPIHHSDADLVLYDVYNPWKQGHGLLNITKLATWNPRTGLSFHMPEVKFTRRFNLHKMTFRTAFFGSKYKPENVSLEHYLENFERSTVDGFTKFGYIVLKNVAEMFNISLHIKEIAKWEKNDTIGPMTRALNSCEIDICGNPVVMTAVRLSLIKFVYPSWPFRTCFLLRSPQPNNMKYGEILRPFDSGIWTLMTFTLIICGTALYVTLTFEGADGSLMRCSNSLLITIGAICQQGTNTAINQVSSRITFLCILMYSYLMYNYYSACVVSARLSEPVTKINDSLNELAKTGIKVASEPLLYFDFFIKENKWETKMFYAKRWLTTPEEERFIHPNQGMQLVKEGSHAYHTHPDVGYPYINRFYTNRQICELTEVDLVRLNYATIAVTYNSTIVELMKIGFARLSECGIRRRQLNYLTAIKPHCRRDILIATSIAMNEFAPHLVVLAIGAAIALAICTFEIYIFEYNHNPEKLSRIHEWLKRKIYAVMAQANDWRLYDEMHDWLIFTDGNFSKTVGQLDELNGFGMSTDLVIAVPSRNGYELFDVYNPWKDGGAKINITPFGTWNHSASLHVTLTQSKFRRRCNFHGLKMKSHFFRSNYRPKNMSVEDYMRNDTFGFKDGLSRFGYNLVTHLSEMYNFTLQFGEIKKWLHGDTLGPMSRALIQNEIQITGSPVIITQERLRLTKFVYPAWPFRTCFMFRNPQKKDIKIGEVLHPFADESWFAIIVTLIGICGILALSLKQENYEISQDVWSNSFLITLGSLCQQATHFNFDGISTRILVVILMIFSYFIYTYYNVTILSARLNEPILKVNDSLNELGKLGFKMASEPMNYFEFIFTQLTEWERKVFYDDRWLKIPESERFMFPEEAVPLVQKGGFAYHTHPDVSYPIIDKIFSLREICELMEVHPVPLRYSTLSVNYNSSFVELAKVGLSRMTEVGLRHRQIRRWTSRKPLCNREEITVTNTDIYGFAPHLILLAFGFFMTGTFLTTELVFNYWSNRNGQLKISTLY